MLLIIILLFIPLIFSLITFFTSKRFAPFVALFSSIISLFYFLILMSSYHVKERYLSFNTSFEWISSMRANLHFGLDATSILPLFLTQLIVCLSILATLVKGNERNSAFYGLIGLAHAGLNGFFSAQNPVTFFVFFELALIPVYFIVLNNGGPERKKAVFKFFLYTVFGGLLMLAAVLFLQSRMIDTLKLSTWTEFYQNKLALKYQYWMLVAFLVAFAIKSPVFPFHSWQANLYSQADRPALMIIAGVMSKMGIFGLLRFNFIYPDALFDWRNEIMTICLIGVIYGALIAWRQKDILRLLAYSSLSHMGLIAAATFTLSNKGVQGSLFSILAHGIASAGLFFVADVMMRRTNDSSIYTTSGLAKDNPRFAGYFFVIVLSTIGLPFTCGFIGEFYNIWAIADYKTSFGLFAAVTLILGAVYMLRLYQKTMFGVPSSNANQFDTLNLSEDYVFIVIVVLIFALGFFPADWIGFGQFAFNYMVFTPTVN